MNRDDVMRWVGGYERACRNGDLGAVAELFTEDARYRPSPYEEAEIGHAAIRAFWLDDEGQTFGVQAQSVAVQDRDAVVRLMVRYGDPVRQEYRDLWVLHFAWTDAVTAAEPKARPRPPPPGAEHHPPPRLPLCPQVQGGPGRSRDGQPCRRAARGGVVATRGHERACTGASGG
jgi:SnoaL-like domain